MRTLRRAALAAVLTLAAAGIAAAPAQAATCSGFGCDRKDPIATGCANNVNNTASAWITNGVGQRLALVELRWSLTCSTNWGKITKTSQGNRITITATRPSPFATTATYGGTASSFYGDQLYGAGMTVCAIGTATDLLNPQSPTYTTQVCG